MAIYHFHASKGRRGQSAAAKFSYVTRTGKYKRSRDVLLHATSGRMPAWAETPADFWEMADARERKNGRLFREYEFALPIELTLDQQRAVAEKYAEHITSTHSLPWSLALHAGHGTNPHAHLLINERMNDGIDRPAEKWFGRANKKNPAKGGALKTDALEKKRWLRAARRDWEVICNRALESAGSDARIDHRTLAQQGIDREPTSHIGPTVLAMEARGVATQRGIDASAVPGRPGQSKSDKQEDEDGQQYRERLADLEDRIRVNVERNRHAAQRAESGARRDDSRRRTASIREAARRRDVERARAAAVRLGGATVAGGDRGGLLRDLDAGGPGDVRDVRARHDHPGRGRAAASAVPGGAPRPEAGGVGVHAPGGAAPDGSAGRLTPALLPSLVMVIVVRGAAGAGAGEGVRLAGYRRRTVEPGLVALVRASDPDAAWTRPRIVDRGSGGLWLGGGGDAHDCRAMLALAARRWDRLRLSAGSAAGARLLVRRAVEAGLVRGQVAELSFPGGDGEPAAVVSGAALDRWFAADVAALTAAPYPKPEPGPKPPRAGPGPAMG